MYEDYKKESDKRGVGRPPKEYTEDERPEHRPVAMPHRLWLLLPESSERNKVIANLVEIAYGDSSLRIKEIDGEIHYLSGRINDLARSAVDKVKALVKEKEDILRAKAKIDESKRKEVI
jgi:hypothetical protein